MKARNIVYRLMLNYFLWMARLPPRVQWALVIGAFVGSQIIIQVADNSPALAPFLWPLLYAYIAFVFMTWQASPLFDLVLRLDRLGRYGLSPDQIRGANVLLASLLVILISISFAIWTDHELVWYGTLAFAVTSLSASAIYRSEPGWPRNWAIAITLTLAAAIPLVVLPVVLIPGKPIPTVLVLGHRLLRNALPFALLASQFVASYLMTVRVKR
jgi:hypothetical protein